MANPNTSGKREQKTPQQIASDKYKYGGERYGFRGNNHWGPDDWIPQVSGLYAFPKGDIENPVDPPEN